MTHVRYENCYKILAGSDKRSKGHMVEDGRMEEDKRRGRRQNTHTHTHVIIDTKSKYTWNTFSL